MNPAAGDPSKRRQEAYTAGRRFYWDEFARSLDRWQTFRGYYQKRLRQLYSFWAPPGLQVLEIGCGTGDLLNVLQPSLGVGIDISRAMVELARTRHPLLEFHEADAHDFDLGRQFDVIVCSDVLNDVWDVQTVLERIRRHCHADTRILVNIYSRLWELPRRLAEALGLARPLLQQNWLTLEDLRNLCRLAGLEPVRDSREILCPFAIPLLASFADRFLVKFWPLQHLSLTNFLIVRPTPAGPPPAPPRISVIVPARNEEGNIPAVFDRLPQMGAGTELILVEGHSTDGTWQAAQRELALRPGYPAKLLRQKGRGKGDAVRLGFAEASGDLLMILDADLTVAPEDLPRFYQAWLAGKGEFINGVRLVYPMEGGAMRCFNFLGNKFFSLAFGFLLGQTVKDTLCGTKALSRRHYEAIAANRGFLGDLDPYGDFDLLFGAARLNLKIVDLPVRYGIRTYGTSNIRRWRHGWLLLRMACLALRRLKCV